MLHSLIVCVLFLLRTVLLQCVCLLFAADHLERKQAMSGGGDQFNVIKCNDVMPPQPVPCICNVMPPPPVMPQAVCFHCEAWMGGLASALIVGNKQ